MWNTLENEKRKSKWENALPSDILLANINEALSRISTANHTPYDQN